MVRRSKEYNTDAARMMRESPLNVKLYLEVAMEESDLDIFQALAAAIASRGEVELAAKTGVPQPHINRAKKTLRDPDVEEPKKMKLACQVLRWFDLEFDQKQIISTIRQVKIN